MDRRHARVEERVRDGAVGVVGCVEEGEGEVAPGEGAGGLEGGKRGRRAQQVQPARRALRAERAR